MDHKSLDLHVKSVETHKIVEFVLVPFFGLTTWKRIEGASKLVSDPVLRKVGQINAFSLRKEKGRRNCLFPLLVHIFGLISPINVGSPVKVVLGSFKKFECLWRFRHTTLNKTWIPYVPGMEELASTTIEGQWDTHWQNLRERTAFIWSDSSVNVHGVQWRVGVQCSSSRQGKFSCNCACVCVCVNCSVFCIGETKISKVSSCIHWARHGTIGFQSGCSGETTRDSILQINLNLHWQNSLCWGRLRCVVTGNSWFLASSMRRFC